MKWSALEMNQKSENGGYNKSSLFGEESGPNQKWVLTRGVKLSRKLIKSVKMNLTIRMN